MTVDVLLMTITALLMTMTALYATGNVRRSCPCWASGVVVFLPLPPVSGGASHACARHARWAVAARPHGSDVPRPCVVFWKKTEACGDPKASHAKDVIGRVS